MKLKIVNNRPLVENGLDLNFAIIANQPPINLTSTPQVGSGLTYNVSYKVSDFLTGSTGTTGIIDCEYINSGRLYFGYGTLPSNGAGNIAPIPNGNQYFGWVEFSSWTADTCVWINLSNVDIVGLPISLSSNTWSLGYKESANTLIGSLASKYPNAVINTDIGKKKILAPNADSSSFGSFDGYFNHLSTACAALAINSDTLSDGTQKTFTGNFSPSLSAITLTSNSGDTFVLYYTALTSDIIYRGDGATIFYNGVTIDQNRSGKTDDVISSNSTFRNIIIGLNEGYFEASPDYSGGVNYSINYPYLEPFRYLDALGCRVGNMYAKEIHDASNSYGFAYADSNLKTLIQSPLNDEIVVTIMGDDDVMCYENVAPYTQNCPGWGPVQFAFGQYSGELGYIKVGNCMYSAATNSVGCGSFLPYVSEWVKMEFLGTINSAQTEPNYIWVKPATLEVAQIWSADTGGIITTGWCLSNGVSLVNNPVAVPKGTKLTWGASNSWNPGVPNAFNPSGVPPTPPHGSGCMFGSAAIVKIASWLAGVFKFI